MFKTIAQGWKRGLTKIKDHPQLIYTIVVAFIIFFAFIFTADRFLGIAQDAQDRLINVRIGSIHDTFAEFAPASLDNPFFLENRIKDISNNNQTITEFRLVKPFGESYVISASMDSEETGAFDNENGFLYNIAKLDPDNSFTFEGTDTETGERFFKTVRAIPSEEGNEASAFLLTRQTLSEADRQIQDNIRNSIIILVFILLLVLFLFFRHSRIIDYVALYQKLKEVDELKDDFISMASHELRTPLTVIRGYADMAKESKDKMPSETVDYIDNIEKSSKQLEGLIEDMLNVSRIEQGRMEFNYERINPESIVKDVLDSFKRPAEQKGLNLKVEIEGSETINVDSGRLRQVLVNLIGNAVKYTKEGGITIKMYTEKDRQYIRVIDTGMGMSEEEKAGLFQKFYRIKSEDTKEIRGTGLGLWITKQIVELMNGKISVESIKEVGSHFIISFPTVK